MQDADLTGRVALVTGAAHRLGRAIAIRLHAAGADVAIHYHTSEAEAQALAEELNVQGPGTARTFGGALDDPETLAPLVEAVVADLGRLDILVNNASRFEPTPLGETDAATWDAVLDTNLRAPFLLTQAAREYLTADGGAVINLADIHGERPLAGHTAYSVSKAALTMLTQSLAKELGPAVRVNAVAPGVALWPEDGLTEAEKEAMLQRSVMGQPSGAEPVAKAVHYLATADYITGQVLGVEGGRLLY